MSKKMKSLEKYFPTQRLDYKHYVLFDGRKYIRKETLSIKHYAWENEPDNLLDLHIIEWKKFSENYTIEYDSIEYFNNDSGWAKDGKCDKSNPVPEIERIFKETVGKDLIYFQ